MRRVFDFLGTRRSVMVVIAMSSIFRGLTVWHDTGTAFRGQAILFYDLQPELRITGWMATAAIALLVAVFARSSREWIGWCALAFMPAERIISYLWAFAAWLLPSGNQGTPWALAYAGQWTCALLLLALVATWSEDSPRRLSYTKSED